jgi:hypothetical protein
MHTKTQRLLLLVLLVTASLAATGCAQLVKDPRDAPWDPKNGRAIHEQLPNWDHPYGKTPCYHPDGCGKR